MKKALIFGGNGFVWYYLAKEFKENGYYVSLADITELRDNIKQYTDSYSLLNILDTKEVERIVSELQPDYIVNLAAISSVAASWNIPVETISVNVNGSISILEAVRKTSKHTKVLLVGSSEEYDVKNGKISENDPLRGNNPYGISKMTQESFAKLYREAHGLNIVNTRTFNHTGIGQPTNFVIPSFVKQAADIHRSGKPGVIRVGNLEIRRDIGDVRDMVSAYRVILEGNSKETLFNVGSGESYVLKDILEDIISLSGPPITVEVDPSRIRPVENPTIWCDNSRMKREFGWEPQHNVFEAIRNMFFDFLE